MRGALAAVLLGALVLVGGGGAGGGAPAYATLSRGVTSELVRVDPATLRILGPGLPLWRHDLPWSRSPDGGRLAVGSGRTRSIRLVDLRAWRALRDVRLPGQLIALAWPRDDRLVAIVAARCCPQPLRALSMDPADGRRTSARLGSGSIVAAARTPTGLALLLAPQGRIGGARLALVDAAGRVRSVRIDGIRAGWETVGRASRAGPPLARYRTPGLAVEPAGRRALVAGGEALATVDLRTLAVHVEPIRTRTLADGGFSSGTYRRALWLRGDLVAVTGWTDRVSGKGAQRRQTTSSAGLQLVDARTLGSRRVDPYARAITRAGELVLTTGSRGVRAYGFDGRRRYGAAPRRWLGELPAAGSYVYLGAADTYKRHRVQVLDARSGRRVREVWVRGALTLLTDSSPRICWC